MRDPPHFEPNRRKDLDVPAMVESLLGPKKAEAETETDQDSVMGASKIGVDNYPSATMGEMAIAAKSGRELPLVGRQSAPSVLDTVTSVFKPVTTSDCRSSKEQTPSTVKGQCGMGAAGQGVTITQGAPKDEATKRRIRSTVVSSAVFRSLAADQLEAVIDAMAAAAGTN